MSTPTDHSFPVEGSRSSALVRCSSRPHDSGTAAAENLVDELLLEIIPRVPPRERWRCKQVCKRWLCLAKTLPQSLAGFFYTTYCSERLPKFALHFFNISGNIGVPRSVCFDSDFLPDHRRMDLLDCRNGLLLCGLCCASDQAANSLFYVVCNPATQEWVALPNRSHSACKVIIARLGFDPAGCSHFHVFLLLEDDTICISGVDLYSSETGKWVRKEKRWDQDVRTTDAPEETVFLNGFLHFHYYLAGHGNNFVPYLAAVATDGETWTTISVPTLMTNGDGFIQVSQGRLHYACLERDEDDVDDEDDEADVKLAIYVLEDYDSKRWKLKHKVQATYIFGGLVDPGHLDCDFDWIAIHPECNVIFFAAGNPKQLVCYNMDLQKTKVMRPLRDGQSPYLPYVPLYTELQSLRM